MATVSEKHIASFLRNHRRLVYQWEYFYYRLNLQLDDTPAIERAWSLSRCSFGLMRNLIGQWVTEKGPDATVNALARVLEACEQNNAKDLLLEKFPTTARIVPFDIERFEGQVGQNMDLMPEETEEDIELQKKTSGSVTILQLVDTRQAGNRRLLVCISHLLHILSQIGNRPVSIISINGKQRSGKSFLANQFIRYLKYANTEENWLDAELESHFEWRASYESVTSGVQIWHEPLYVNVGGREIAVILMDTQGLHDPNTAVHENAIIFGISVLLSSVFIYNDKHVAEDSLQYLRSFLELAKFASGEKVAENRFIFQKLILLIRDFQDEEEFAFGYYDDENYPPNQNENLKSRIFEPTKKMETEAIETRSAIQACFEKVGVYAMSSPGSRMPNRFKESSQWDSDFFSSIVDFVTTILNPEAVKNSTKRVFGQETTGEQLKVYVTKWVQLIQEADGMVQAKSIFESTAHMFYTNKIDKCSHDYQTSMSTHVESNSAGFDVSDLNKFHEILVTNIVSEFTSERALGGTSMLIKYKEKLLETLNGIKDDFFKVNERKIAAEQERTVRERELTEAQTKQHETEKLAIANANSLVQNAKYQLGIAEGKVQQVKDNRQSYRKAVCKKEKHRVMGIKYATSRYTDWEDDYEQFQQALNTAQAELERKQQEVNVVERQLNDTCKL